MKHKILLFICCLPLAATYSQNLVNNYSFEQFDTCPDNEAQIEYATGWYKTASDADYYNACSSNPSWTVPPGPPYSTYQLAATGNAFAGLIVFVAGIGPLEIIHTQLLSALVPGTKYYISLKVSLSIRGGPGQLNMATDKLGLKFTTGSNPAIDNSAHLFSNTIIVDDVNWVPISGSFIADSAYTNLYLGLFFEEININTVQLTTSDLMDRAYYYIDDVCVSTDSIMCNIVNRIEEKLKIKNEEFEIYPNPTTGQISLTNLPESRNAKVSVYNVLGELVYDQPFIDRQIDLSYLPTGMYMLRIDQGETILRKKIIKL